jgi:hypothetical protein
VLAAGSTRHKSGIFLFIAHHGVVTLANPNLDADFSIGRLGFVKSIIDIGSKGMKGHPAFLVLFGPAHIRAAEATGHAHLATLGSTLHGGTDGHLHGPAEGTATFELPAYALRYELGIGLDLFDFLDLDIDLLGSKLLQIQTDTLDICALLPDQHTRFGGVYDDRDFLRVPNYLDLGYIRVLGLGQLIHPLAKRQIFMQGFRVITGIDVPSGLPILVNPKP